MTDNEIMKALECCSAGTFACSEDCPCFHSKSNLKVSSCRFELVGDALDLITRQKAEIERLQEVNDSFTDIGKLYSEIKAEAIKEFADRLKNEIISDTAYGCDSSQHTGYYDYQIKIGDIPEYIDNLVKEMVGDV